MVLLQQPRRLNTSTIKPSCTSRIGGRKVASPMMIILRKDILRKERVLPPNLRKFTPSTVGKNGLDGLMVWTKKATKAGQKRLAGLAFANGCVHGV